MGAGFGPSGDAAAEWVAKAQEGHEKRQMAYPDVAQHAKDSYVPPAYEPPTFFGDEGSVEAQAQQQQQKTVDSMLKSQKVVQELGKDPPGMSEIQACILCIDETVDVAEGMLAIGADAVPDCTVADVCAAIVEGDLIDGDIVR